MSVVANVAINIDGKQAQNLLKAIQGEVEKLNGAFKQIPKRTGGIFDKLKGAATSAVGQPAAVTGAAVFTCRAIAAKSFAGGGGCLARLCEVVCRRRMMLLLLLLVLVAILGRIFAQATTTAAINTLLEQALRNNGACHLRRAFQQYDLCSFFFLSVCCFSFQKAIIIVRR